MSSSSCSGQQLLVLQLKVKGQVEAEELILLQPHSKLLKRKGLLMTDWKEQLKEAYSVPWKPLAS